MMPSTETICGICLGISCIFHEASPHDYVRTYMLVVVLDSLCMLSMLLVCPSSASLDILYKEYHGCLKRKSIYNHLFHTFGYVGVLYYF